MDSLELEVLSQTLQWLEQGTQVALVTVVKTWGSTPRPPGALLAVNATGSLIGSVSGGCVEDDLVTQVKAGLFTGPTLLQYGLSEAQSRRLGLSCGGSLELLVEPLTQVDSIKPAVLALQQRQLIARQVHLTTGQVSWPVVSQEAAMQYDGQYLTSVFGPSWQLLLVGAGQIARYLAEFALALNYQVVVCDPRVEYTATWQVAGTSLTPQMPDDAVRTLAQDRRSAVVTLTHDPKLDDLALLEAFSSSAFYIGALGSKTTSAQRRQRLLSLGVSEEALRRLHAPVGLPIGSHQTPEIAIAILAEMIAVRNESDFDLR